VATTELWSLISPFVAASTAVWLARRQDRERVSCFVDTAYEWGEEGPYTWLYVGIHNHSPHAIAIRSVKFLTGGIVRRAKEGTALDFEDPFDLAFPYRVEPGEIKTIALDGDAARKVVRETSPVLCHLNNLLSRPRVMIECRTTAGTRFKGSGEGAMPWDERQRWVRR
jgi:hypothetical protein